MAHVGNVGALLVTLAELGGGIQAEIFGALSDEMAGVLTGFGAVTYRHLQSKQAAKSDRFPRHLRTRRILTASGRLASWADCSSKPTWDRKPLGYMVSRRETLAEALREWRTAERELFESGDGNDVLEANVTRLRAEYQRLYTEGMVENMDRLHEADARRSRAVPSTSDFHEATRDTEDAAMDIWEQARRGDRDTPPTRKELSRP